MAYEGSSEGADAYLRAAASVSRESGVSLQVHVGLTLSNDLMRSSFLPMLYESECVPAQPMPVTASSHICCFHQRVGDQRQAPNPPSRFHASIPFRSSREMPVVDRSPCPQYAMSGAPAGTEANDFGRLPSGILIAW